MSDKEFLDTYYEMFEAAAHEVADQEEKIILGTHEEVKTGEKFCGMDVTELRKKNG